MPSKKQLEARFKKGHAYIPRKAIPEQQPVVPEQQSAELGEGCADTTTVRRLERSEAEDVQYITCSNAAGSSGCQTLPYRLRPRPEKKSRRCQY